MQEKYLVTSGPRDVTMTEGVYVRVLDYTRYVEVHLLLVQRFLTQRYCVEGPFV